MTANKEQMQSETTMRGSLIDRLEGRYPVGPEVDGEPEFGYRQFDQSGLPPIQAEAAARIRELEAENEALCRGMKLAADHLGYVGDWYASYPIVQLIEVNQRLRAEVAKIRQANPTTEGGEG